MDWNRILSWGEFFIDRGTESSALYVGDGTTPLKDLKPVGYGAWLTWHQQNPEGTFDDFLQVIKGAPGKDGLDGIILTPGEALSYALPGVGEIVAVLSNTPPPGTLICDGSVLLVEDYINLANHLIDISPHYALGDGVSFMLPDMRDQFLRGQSGDRVLGSLQGDAIREIAGEIHTRSGSGSSYGPVVGGAGAFFGVTPKSVNWGSLGCIAFTSSSWGDTTHFSAAAVVPTADENRPKNIAVNFCIRYKAYGVGPLTFQMPPDDGQVYSAYNGGWIPNALLEN